MQHVWECQKVQFLVGKIQFSINRHTYPAIAQKGNAPRGLLDLDYNLKILLLVLNPFTSLCICHNPNLDSFGHTSNSKGKWKHSDSISLVNLYPNLKTFLGICLSFGQKDEPATLKILCLLIKMDSKKYTHRLQVSGRNSFGHWSHTAEWCNGL